MPPILITKVLKRTARLMPTAPMQILLKNRMARLHMSTTAHVVRAKARGDAQYAMARDEPYRVGDVISVWYHALSAAQAEIGRAHV